MSSEEKGIVLRGAMTALVTPFDEDGAVDVTALKRMVRRQVSLGIHGLVPCGTTGEGATLSDEEHRQVIETVVQSAEGRVPVVAGCGSNDTRRTVAAAVRAADAGADALLVVTPYYNKPNRSGMLAHYESVAGATALPLVVYNVPSRTGQNLGPDLVLELARIPGIVGVKEASADLEQIATILHNRPPGFSVLSGDDSLVLPTMALGAEGVISVASNQAPAEMAALADAVLAGDLQTARALHFRLLSLMRTNFCESNPVPVKVAMGLLGLCHERTRAPLGPPSDESRAAIERALSSAAVRGSER